MIGDWSEWLPFIHYYLIFWMITATKTETVGYIFFPVRELNVQEVSKVEPLFDFIRHFLKSTSRNCTITLNIGK